MYPNTGGLTRNTSEPNLSQIENTKPALRRTQSAPLLSAISTQPASQAELASGHEIISTNPRAPLQSNNPPASSTNHAQQSIQAHNTPTTETHLQRLARRAQADATRNRDAQQQKLAGNATQQQSDLFNNSLENLLRRGQRQEFRQRSQNEGANSRETTGRALDRAQLRDILAAALRLPNFLDSEIDDNSTHHESDNESNGSLSENNGDGSPSPQQ